MEQMDISSVSNRCYGRPVTRVDFMWMILADIKVTHLTCTRVQVYNYVHGHKEAIKLSFVMGPEWFIMQKCNYRWPVAPAQVGVMMKQQDRCLFV